MEHVSLSRRIAVPTPRQEGSGRFLLFAFAMISCSRLNLILCIPPFRDHPSRPISLICWDLFFLFRSGLEYNSRLGHVAC